MISTSAAHLLTYIIVRRSAPCCRTNVAPSLKRQPIERVRSPPIFTGAGKSPDLTQRQIVACDRPVTSRTSGNRIILSISDSISELLTEFVRSQVLQEGEQVC